MDEDNVRLLCADCGADLYVELKPSYIGHIGISMARQTSILGTLAWISTRFFRCGTCFIKKQRERRGKSTAQV